MKQNSSSLQKFNDTYVHTAKYSKIQQKFLLRHSVTQSHAIHMYGMSMYVHTYVATAVWNFSIDNISLIKKFKVNYFHGYMTSSKYFTLNIIIASDNCDWI